MITDEVLPGLIAILNGISHQNSKTDVQAFPLQCLPTHHGGSVHAGIFFTNDINTDGDANSDGDANKDGDDGENTEESFYLQVADVRT